MNHWLASGMDESRLLDNVIESGLNFDDLLLRGIAGILAENPSPTLSTLQELRDDTPIVQIPKARPVDFAIPATYGRAPAERRIRRGSELTDSTGAASTGASFSQGSSHRSHGLSDTCSDISSGSSLDLQKAADSGAGLRHPFVHPSGVEVNLFNCVAIFMAYCKAVLGAAFNDTLIFEYRRISTQTVDTLDAVQYPGPNGMNRVTRDQALEAWGGKGLHDIVDHRQVAGLREVDRQKIQFVYPVVLDMIQRGFIDEHNKPSRVVQSARSMPASPLLPVMGAPLPIPPIPPVPAPVPPGAAPSAGSEPRSPAKPAAPWQQNKDPKSLLNELKHKVNLALQYDTVSVWPRSPASRFQTTLLVNHQDKQFTFKGDVCHGKKAAEQSAALAAVYFITDGGLENAAGAGAVAVPPAPASAPFRTPVMAPIHAGPSRAPNHTVSSMHPVPLFDAPSPEPLTPFKAKLQELLNVLGQGSVGSLNVRYVAVCLPGGWQASVQIELPGGAACVFAGSVAPTKADSEEKAAMNALQELLHPTAGPFAQY